MVCVLFKHRSIVMNKFELRKEFSASVKALIAVDKEVLTRELIPGIDVLVKRPTEVDGLIIDFETLLRQETLSIHQKANYMVFFEERKKKCA